MRLVFPTLWSPSKTILVRLGGDEEKSAAGVDGESDMSVKFKVETKCARYGRHRAEYYGQECDHVTQAFQNLTKVM